MSQRPALSSLPSPGLPVASPRTLALPRGILAPRFATALRAAAAPMPSSAAVYLLDDGWLEYGRLGVEQIAEEPLPPPEDVPLVLQQIAEEPLPPPEDAPLVLQQIAVLALDGLLSLCFPPAQTHRPFQVFVQAPHAAVSEKCL